MKNILWILLAAILAPCAAFAASPAADLPPDYRAQMLAYLQIPTPAPAGSRISFYCPAFVRLRQPIAGLDKERPYVAVRIRWTLASANGELPLSATLVDVIWEQGRIVAQVSTVPPGPLEWQTLSGEPVPEKP